MYPCSPSISPRWKSSGSHSRTSPVRRKVSERGWTRGAWGTMNKRYGGPLVEEYKWCPRCDVLERCLKLTKKEITELHMSFIHNPVHFSTS